MSLPAPYLLFLGDVPWANRAKTGLGIAYWARDLCTGQWRMPGCAADTGLPDLRPSEAVEKGARSLVLGVAPLGGAIPEAWHPYILEALESGLDVISGMHARLSDLPEITAAAERFGRRLHDVRHTDRTIPPANALKRRGLRCLMVGLDSALGKKFTALALTAELKARGAKATFRATGQTGIIIAGGGIAVDAVKADFVAGAAELISAENEADHWDVIEGQGSLFHGAYAAVTLGLIHGSQPDAMVLCGHATRDHLELLPHIPHRSYLDAISVHEQLARVTNPASKVVAISVNTSGLEGEASAQAHINAIADATGLPTTDPIRFGCRAMADALIAMTPQEAVS
ncbi:MAG: DUF1611 domain-containing protein [Pseudomonadota bacterium]